MLEYLVPKSNVICAGPADLPFFDLLSIFGKLRAGFGAMGFKPAAPVRIWAFLYVFTSVALLAVQKTLQDKPIYSVNKLELLTFNVEALVSKQVGFITMAVNFTQHYYMFNSNCIRIWRLFDAACTLHKYCAISYMSNNL